MSLEIKIIGYAGEGKTSIAHLIQKTLSDHGFNVKLSDDDNLQISDELLEQRLISLADASKRNVIEIKTVRNRRSKL